MEGIIKDISVNDIVNYNENPRHVEGNDEKDTLKKLFHAVGVQYMLNLAEDIQTYGILNSQHVVVVYSESLRKYVVYEGNRRVAAIKLLLNPSEFDFLDRSSLDKAIRIAERGNVTNKLNCYITNEDEAFFIMERLHSGEDKGRGIKQWSAREKEVFKVRQNKEKQISYLIDLYVKKELDGFDITTVLPFTTLKRIFNNREVKKKIGLDVNNEKTFTKERMQTVVDASLWIVQESEKAGLAVTRLFNRAKTIEDKLIPWLTEYMLHQVAEKSKENKKNEHNVSIKSIEVAKQKQIDRNQVYINKKLKNDNVNTERSESQGLHNIYSNGSNRSLPYFFQGLNYGNLDPNDPDTHGVLAVCKELQLFSDKRMVEAFPLSAAFLIRSIIEHTIKFYSKKNKIQGQNRYIWENVSEISKLSKLINNYNNNLPNYITSKEIRSYFKRLFDDYETNVDPLNWVIHRPNEFKLDSKTLIELPKQGLLALINYMLNSN